MEQKGIVVISLSSRYLFFFKIVLGINVCVVRPLALVFSPLRPTWFLSLSSLLSPEWLSLSAHFFYLALTSLNPIFPVNQHTHIDPHCNHLQPLSSGLLLHPRNWNGDARITELWCNGATRASSSSFWRLVSLGNTWNLFIFHPCGLIPTYIIYLGWQVCMEIPQGC